MTQNKEPTLREMLYGAEDKAQEKKEKQAEAIRKWRDSNRTALNHYNRRRARRLKWEKRCGRKLKDLPASVNKCDLCSGRIPLGYKQPYKHGSVCSVCAMTFKHFSEDPNEIRKAAAYLNLVTENWTNDSHA